MSPAFNLRRLAQKLLLVDKKKRVVNRWRRLGIKALKIVKQRQLGEGYIKDNTKGRAQKRTLKVLGKWSILANKLLRKHDGRTAMQARLNLSRLARKLLLSV